jgi:phosphopantothenoylcysteine decarboxylase/phosphopantothenate--cysteine ligase
MVKAEAHVWTVMTRSATEFVRPLTFPVLSGQPVRTDLFSAGQEGEIEHITLADMAEVAVIAPATANVIGKMARGIADDMLTTVCLALRCPTVVCPAMNVNMYQHPAVQENLLILKNRGIVVVEPQEGELACGWEGKGRLADLETIMEAIRAAVTPGDLTEEHILVTAGPTREALDPVRFLSNHSSGKMGYALARVALRRGAQVTLISGPTSLDPPPGAHFQRVESVQQMHETVMEHLETATVVVKAAAPCDYRPAEVHSHKIKKRDEDLHLPLQRTPDILADIGRRKGKRLLVGFAAETRDLLKNAGEKLHRKNADWIVANDLTQPGAGFGVDTNEVTILHRDGSIEKLKQMSKEEVASAILDRIAAHRKAGGVALSEAAEG